MKKLALLLFLAAVILINPNQSRTEDTELFMTNIPPDALILLDKSGSMNLDPAGNWANYPNRRIDIARQIIFDLLDNNHDGRIDEVDEKSLNIRFGFMRFWNSNDNDYVSGEYGDPWTGSIKVLSGIGSPYSNIWSNVDYWAESDGLGGTPLAASLEEAKGYFTKDVNPIDPAVACRQKFIILITDGEDTYACSGDGSESQPDMYKRRMLTVQKAKELYDAGIKLLVVAFGGTISESLKRILNWTAKYGGTDNPLEMNSGDPSTYDNTRYGFPCSTTDIKADPVNYPLSGYAFLAADASQLRKAMEAIAKYIQEKSYSFTAPSNPAFWITDRDVLYISSFLPNYTPFWKGNIRAYGLNAHGSLPVDKDGNPLNSSLIWDASEKLMTIAPGSRKIYTYVGLGLKSFDYENLTNADLAVSSDLERQRITNHIRGIDAYDMDQDGNTTETREWKLGDIFHSNAVIVGEPSRFYEGAGFGGTEGFYQIRKDRAKVILAGANDGMLHAFDAATGNEQWAFVPNSLLKNLKFMAAAHTYYVDSSPKVADAWFYKSLTDAAKGPDDWKTVLICGLRKGGRTYFALDITDTLNPKYLWEFPKSADTATLGKMGQSWGEPPIGRVKVEVGGELYERWAAFIGGGFDYTNNTGKAFFVIDIKTGDIIKEFSGIEDMKYSFAAPPTSVDTNSDGYVDKIYIGDLGGQMWVFDVPFDEETKKSNSKWTGKVLFKDRFSQAERHPIYYQPAVAFDRYGNPWVYFGTGDREHPNDLSTPAESFYAVKDNRVGNYPRGETDLLDVTSVNRFSPTPKDGWYLRLEKSSQKSEKVLAKPVIFNKSVYFTTYAYAKTENPCSVLGEAKLYVVEYLSGAGASGVDDLSDSGRSPSQRSKQIGVGVPSSPVIKVDSKGKASVTIGTTDGQLFSTQILSPSKSKGILYWREIIP